MLLLEHRNIIIVEARREKQKSFLPAQKLIHDWRLRQTEFLSSKMAWVQLANESTPLLITSLRNQRRKILYHPSRFAKKRKTFANVEITLTVNFFCKVCSPPKAQKPGDLVCWLQGWSNAFRRYHILREKRGTMERMWKASVSMKNIDKHLHQKNIIANLIKFISLEIMKPERNFMS